MSIVLYEKFQSKFSEENFGEMMPFDWIEIPNEIHIKWALYLETVKGYSREISNAINGFTIKVRRLCVWSDMWDELNDDEKQDTLHEFIEPVACLALVLPYAIRSRFIFAVACLSHMVNMRKNDEWREDYLPKDSEIWFEAADKQGREWKPYKKLKPRLEAIGNKRFTESTEDYRNAFSHRFPKNLLIGMTVNVNRYSNRHGLVSYGFGYNDPMKLDVMLLSLKEQAEICYKAFEEFKKLVEEQIIYVVEDSAQSLKG